MGRWVWQNDDGSIEVPPTDLANHLSQSVNGYKQQQQSSQAKVSNTGAYVQNGGTWEQNMTQLGQQLNPQQRQPVAYWNPNTNVVYAGGMPTQMPQAVQVGYGYSPGYGTAPLVYDMTQGQYIGGSMNQFGPTGNATVPMTTETTVTPAASNNTSTKTKKSKETQNTSSNDNSFAEEIVNNAINNSTNTSSVSIPLQSPPNPPLNYTTVETPEDTTDEVVNSPMNVSTNTSTDNVVGNATGEIQWSRLPQALLLKSLGLPEQYPQAWADRGYTDFDHKVVVLRNYGLETYKDIYGQDPTQDVIDAVRNGRRYDYFGGLVQL